MSPYMKALVKAASLLLADPNNKSASAYLSDKHVVKVTRQRRPHRREKNITMLVTFGAPNYAGRQFIRACKKAGEPIPVRKVQLKQYKKR